jgi:hypothetical protein
MKKCQPLNPKIRRDALAISIRAFVPPPSVKKFTRKLRKLNQNQSEWTLLFDTETNTDAAQALRFGAYQLYNCEKLNEAGIFFDAETLGSAEQALLQAYASTHDLKLMTKAQFVDDVFYGIGYELRATIVGFNLPFDLSRLAVRHGPARGKTMRGGFTFQLSTNPWKPRVQVKHLHARAAFIQFTKPRPRFDTRGMQNRRLPIPTRRGAFIDVKTIAVALTSRSFKLGDLAKFLETEHSKHSTDEHGGPLTEAYITYAVEDVRVTWECYRKLFVKFEKYDLKQSRLSQILSEASLGKANLKEMGDQPWRELQPDFPDQLTGLIMSAYYGGRSEVHLRRIVSQVLYCDFLSMYPSVCTLMGLWRFVAAKGMRWHDSTKEVSKFLHRIRLDGLQRPETWRKLTTIVQVMPVNDIFSVRAKYQDERQSTIGLNYLTRRKPLWFTLADCIAAKLLTGKCVKVRRAITFEPLDPQDNLNSIAIMGNADYSVDPRRDDYYRRIIDLRNTTKEKLKRASGLDATRLDSEQQALKTLANATSYGIFVELNVEELDEREQRKCYGPIGKPFSVTTIKGEEPGRYFHPLLATLITGAARLMLTISETLAMNADLDWALCDTDSMALAKPPSMEHAEFLKRAMSVCEWFTPLNLYEQKGPLFKIEDINYDIKGGKRTRKLTPLFCFAVSAKRYALFNIDADGRPVIRKASAHGLGHLRAPYQESDAPISIPMPCMPLDKIGVERWQYDLWYQIIVAALDGHPDQVELDYHPSLNQPAASRYGATTPKLLRWFKTYNQNRSYRDQVKPFNFLLAFQASPPMLDGDVSFAFEVQQKKGPRRKAPSAPKPIAPYNTDIMQAAKNCFDRETGKPISPEKLRTYRESLAQYHLSPESKFLNGDYLDQGPTIRRHVEATEVHHIGKEANHWEEQFYLGFDEEEQIEYGAAPNESKKIFEALRKNIKKTGQREVARESGISRRTLSRVMEGKSVRKEIIARIVDTLRARSSR